MAGVAYGSALLLAAVFAWAGLAKLGNRSATEASFAALGLPAPEGLGIAVPLVELGLAAGLVVAPGWSAVVALGLLAVFTTLLVRAVHSGAQIGCGCFGTARRAPVSFVEVVRNALLAVAALVAVAAERPVAIGLDDAIVVTVSAATAMVVLALCDLYRRTGSVARMDLPR